MTTSWFEFALAMASSSWFWVSSLEKIAQPPHCFLVRVAERRGLPGSVTPGRRPRPPPDEPRRHRERRPLRLVGEPDEPGRLAEACGGVEDVLRAVHRAHQARAAAAHDDAGREELVETGLAHLFTRPLGDLGHARSDDLGQGAPRAGRDPVSPGL